MNNPKLKDRLASLIKVPTLVLWGDSDRIVTPAYGSAYAGLIPGARFVTVAHAGAFPSFRAAATLSPTSSSLLEPDHAHLSHDRGALSRRMECWRGMLRVNLPNRYCDPRVAADQYHRFLDEWAAVRRARHQHLRQRASFDRDLHNRFVQYRARHSCQDDEARAPPRAWHADRQPARSAARRRGMRDDRRDLARAFRYGLHQGRALRDRAVEFAPGASSRALLGSARSHRQGAEHAHDGPFSWEGEHFHYRSVNIWPRPWQQPHPPVWVSVNSVSSVRPVAEHGYVLGTVMTGYAAKKLFEEYRRVWRAAGRPDPVPLDRFCYCCFAAVRQ